LERLDTFFQHAILACVVFILVWAPLAFGSTGPGAFLVIQGVTALSVALWAARWWAQRPFRLFWPPVCWGVLAFLLYAIARCQLVDVEYIGRDQLTHMIVYVALFFVVLHNVNGKESASIIVIALIFVGFCVATLGVVQFIKHDTTLWGVPRPAQYMPRGSGTFYNPNNFAGYLEMIAPLALAYTIMSRFGATIKVLMGYTVLAMLAGIASSVSRGGILSVAAGMIFLCVLLLAQRDFLLPSLVTLTVLVVAGLIFYTQFDSMQRRFSAGIDYAKLDPSARVSYWDAALQLYERHPVWGAGPGHFDVEFGQVRPLRIQDRPQFAHNDYLNTLCDWGTVGMGIIVAICGLLAWGVIQTWNAVRKRGNDLGSSKRSDRTAFLLGATAAIFAAMLHSIVEFNMQIPANAVTAVVLISLIAAQGRFATEGHWKNPGLSGKILLTFLAIGSVYYLATRELRIGKETYWLAKAKSEKISAERSWDCFKKAHEAEPTNPQTDYLLGESLRLVSKDGNRGYKEKAREAIDWFGRGMDLNTFDARFPLRIGMCLDWIDRPTQATPYFALAAHLDTNNYYIALEQGRHFVALGDYDKAQVEIWRSIAIRPTQENQETMRLLKLRLSDPLYQQRK
jgi:O-antigen ligase